MEVNVSELAHEALSMVIKSERGADVTPAATLGQAVLQELDDLDGAPAPDEETRLLEEAVRNLVAGRFGEEHMALIFPEVMSEVTSLRLDMTAHRVEVASARVDRSRDAMRRTFDYTNRVTRALDRGDSIPPPFIDAESEIR